MSNWPIFKAIRNIAKRQAEKNQDTMQGRIMSINKSNGTANVLVRKQSASGLAYPTADTAITDFCREGSVELKVPSASAFKESTFAVISDSNPGKIEKIRISNVVFDENKLVLSTPTQYSHQAMTRVIGVNSAVFGESVLTGDASKGDQTINLQDASFIPAPEFSINPANPTTQFVPIRKKTFLKIYKKNEVIIDRVTVLQKNNNQLKITPALSYDFSSGDRVVASSVPDDDFDTDDEILLENISIKPNGSDYSYAVANQPVLLAAVEGDKNDLVIIGPASALNTNDLNQINFDSKRFSVVIESIEEYASDIVKQYDTSGNKIPDVLIRDYNLSKSKDVKDLDDLESARKFKINIGIRVPYDFFMQESNNQYWLYAIACGTELDPPLDENGNPVLTLSTGGTSFSGFNVEGVSLGNFFYGLEDWNKFSIVKNSKELLQLGSSRYLSSFASDLQLIPKTFNPLLEDPPIENDRIDINSGSSKRRPYVYLKTFILFNYNTPSHFYDDQGSKDKNSYRTLRSKNGQELSFSIKICAGRMDYLSTGEPDPIMPDMVNYKITFKRKGAYRIDSNAVYPPRMSETPISGSDSPTSGYSVTGSYRGEVGWDLETASNYDMTQTFNASLTNNDYFIMGTYRGDSGVFELEYNGLKYYLTIELERATSYSSGDRIVYESRIKDGFYQGPLWSAAPSNTDFFESKLVRAGTVVERSKSLDFLVVEEDFYIRPLFSTDGGRYPIDFNRSQKIKLSQRSSGLRSVRIPSTSAFEEFLNGWSGFINSITGKTRNRESVIKKYKFGGYNYVDNFEDDIVIMLTELKESRFKNYNPDKIMHQTSVMDRAPSTRLPDFFRVNISLGIYKGGGDYRYDHFNRCTQYYRNNDESPWHFNLFGDDFPNDYEEADEAIEVSPGNFLIGINDKKSRRTMKFFHDKNQSFYSDDIDSNNINERSITYSANETNDIIGKHNNDYMYPETPYWQIVYPAARGQLIDIFGKYEGKSKPQGGINTTECKVGVHCVLNTTGDWKKGQTKVIFRFNLSPEAIWHNYVNVESSSPEWGRRLRDGIVRIVIQPVYSLNGQFKIGNSSVFFATTSNSKSYDDPDAGCYQASIERIF